MTHWLTLAGVTSPHDEQPFALQQMAPPKRRRWLPFALAGGLVLALAGGGYAAYAMTRPEPVVEDRNAALVSACQTEAKKKLKSPATAQFSDEKPVELGDRFYYIDGVVDAQNGFGATVRNKYRCKAESKEGTWSVIRVEFSDWP